MPGKKRGRRRGKRRVGWTPRETCFCPRDKIQAEVKLRIEEVEALRLIDLLNLTQEEAAAEMGVSRKTFWNDLRTARKKVAEALTKGKKIKIEGGNYTLK
ncbi:MAG: DUF134 domain-containing protein [Thermoplasmata archaeon]